VTILVRQSGIIHFGTPGSFRIRVPAEKAIALLFSFTGYKTEQRNFSTERKRRRTHRRPAGKRENGPCRKSSSRTSGKAMRQDWLRLNPKYAINIPSPTGGIESLIKIIVGSNNELTSQYSVRGGNYDEN